MISDTLNNGRLYDALTSLTHVVKAVYPDMSGWSEPSERFMDLNENEMDRGSQR